MLSPPKQEEMLGEITSLFEDAVGAYQTKRADRVLDNLAMYRGWTDITRGGNYNLSVTDAEGEANENINISRMLVKASVAQKLRQVPSIEIPAAKDDQAARAKADMTEKLAKSILRRMDQDELHRTISWAQQAGGAWLKVSWDTQRGRVLPQDYDGFTDEEEEYRRQPDGFGGESFIDIFEGDVRFEFVPTCDGFPDPTAKTCAEISHFFHVKLLPTRKLEDRFPVDVNGESTKGRFNIGSTRELHGADDYEREMELSAMSSDGNVLASLVEFWEMPTRAFPQGRFVAFSGPMILAMGPNPYYPTRIPFILFQGDNIVPQSLYADGLLEDVKTIQHSVNRAANKLREHVDKVLNTHLLVPKGSGIDRDTWGDKPGQIIEYNKGWAPTPMPASDIPQGLFEFFELQTTRAQGITGYTDLSRGDPAGGDISGRAVIYSTENSSAMREPDMMSYRRSMLEAVQHAVHLYRLHADDGRLLQMIGDSGKVELVEFKSDEFDWDNDFVPEVFNGKPSSRAARAAEVYEALTSGLLADGPDGERARKMMGDDYAYAAAYDPFARDRQRAKRENLAHLKDPTAVINVKTYDTHQIHLEEHNEYMRTVEFENLPDWQKEVMEQHAELHEIMLTGGMTALASEESGAQQPMQPGPEPMPPGVESPPNGGAPAYPSAAPPSIDEAAQMTDSEMRSADQR